MIRSLRNESFMILHISFETRIVKDRILPDNHLIIFFISRRAHFIDRRRIKKKKRPRFHSFIRDDTYNKNEMERV